METKIITGTATTVTNAINKLIAEHPHWTPAAFAASPEGDITIIATRQDSPHQSLIAQAAVISGSTTAVTRTIEKETNGNPDWRIHSAAAFTHSSGKSTATHTAILLVLPRI